MVGQKSCWSCCELSFCLLEHDIYAKKLGVGQLAEKTVSNNESGMVTGNELFIFFLVSWKEGWHGSIGLLKNTG